MQRNINPDGAMHAYLINPFQQTIEQVEIEPSLDAIRELVGYQTIDSDEIARSDDRLFFDEECFIRSQPQPGRFRLDTLPPVAGIGMVVGGGPDEGTLASPGLTLDELKDRVQFS
ncbi:hypothetical protein [Thioalkalivibrio sp. XN8]|uniref:hypothetical protein n=1 Tax=Thioalkalivibrio sp. XN8 TaxID=2712863 RepID=UPI0013ED000B|nr:hypothetical protein [Thioalkalivibrio sp. XN8]NGP52006.1 hypothetical protein [Thioalkalivibrio sp. XN8]